ncbi:FYVE, RhoGEF and PH domain-containing protein 3 [Balamuthia mandrillaris]
MDGSSSGEEEQGIQIMVKVPGGDSLHTLTLPAGYTVDQVKRAIFRQIPELNSRKWTDFNLGLQEEVLRVEFSKLRNIEAAREAMKQHRALELELLCKHPEVGRRASSPRFSTSVQDMPSAVRMASLHTQSQENLRTTFNSTATHSSDASSSSSSASHSFSNNTNSDNTYDSSSVPPITVTTTKSNSDAADSSQLSRSPSPRLSREGNDTSSRRKSLDEAESTLQRLTAQLAKIQSIVTVELEACNASLDEKSDAASSGSPKSKGASGALRRHLLHEKKVLERLLKEIKEGPEQDLAAQQLPSKKNSDSSSQRSSKRSRPPKESSSHRNINGSKEDSPTLRTKAEDKRKTLSDRDVRSATASSDDKENSHSLSNSGGGSKRASSSSSSSEKESGGEAPGTPIISREEHAEMIRQEFIKTEKTYVSNLEAIVSIFVEPLRQAASDPSSSMLTFKQIDVLFSRELTMLVQMHKKLLDDITAAPDGDTKAFANCLASFIPYLKIYTRYVNNHTEATAMLAELTNTNKKFKTFLQERIESPECNGLALNSYLIMPIQRLPRYELLMKDLLKYSKEEERDKVREILEAVKSVCQHVNESKKKQENYAKLYEVQSSLLINKDKGKSISLFERPGRSFVKEGRIQGREVNQEKGGLVSGVKKPASKLKKFYLFLFDDVLLITLPTKEGKYKLRHAIYLSHISMPNTNSLDEPEVFVVYDITGDLRWHLKPETLEERNSWVEAIEECERELTKKSTAAAGILSGPQRVISQDANSGDGQ